MIKVGLVRLNKKHFPLFHKWWNDLEILKFSSDRLDKRPKAEIDEFLTKHLEDANSFDWIISVNDKKIGYFLIHKKRNKKYWELYIVIGEKEYWGRGIGTIVIKRMCRWFFKKVSTEKVLRLEVNADNSRAVRCYEKVGFKKVRKNYDGKVPGIVMELIK
jgi:RimJ/RimL family protein N-acetyltransferase